MIIQWPRSKMAPPVAAVALALLMVGCPSRRDLPTTTVVTMPIDGIEFVVTLDGTTFTVGEPINFKVEAPKVIAEGDRRLVDEVVCSIVPAAESDPVESARHPIVWHENGGNLVCNVQNIFRMPDDSNNTKISKIRNPSAF